LNLVDVCLKHRARPEYHSHPFFLNSLLNRSIIVKHRLRANELEDFQEERTSATKVVLPLDITDLRLGARTFFVGQNGYKDIIKEIFAGKLDCIQRDTALLSLLDDLPSLDPFLMRERLRKSGLEPARLYFDFTEADTTMMFAFIQQEVSHLVGLSTHAGGHPTHTMTARFAQKILANDNDAEFDPLRLSLGMDRSTFEEGIFCWKGFIYYKWILNGLLPQIRPILAEINLTKPSGPLRDDERLAIKGSQHRLNKAISMTCETVRMTLKLYDDAYMDLTRNGQPKAFRQFLLVAPQLFQELGERIGAIQHVVSFWRFRFPPPAHITIAAEELVDLLLDFEMSLNFNAQGKPGKGLWRDEEPAHAPRHIGEIYPTVAYI
jgi:hypothetical protein